MTKDRQRHDGQNPWMNIARARAEEQARREAQLTDG
jgi:hypothetical protein